MYLLCNVMDLLILYEILNLFCEVTGAKINARKTKIMGFGNWENKINWPGNRFTAEQTSLKCLGIVYHNKWEDTVDVNWALIEKSINTHIRCITSRPLTIFQKSFYINSVILSKLVYVANIIPIKNMIVKRLNQIIFNFIWNGRYNPIKREYMYLPKYKGGVGIQNIQNKCNSVLLKSFLRMYAKEHIFTKFIAYFCESRLKAILPKNVDEISYDIHPFYGNILDLCRNIMHIRSFPMLTCKMIYEVLNPETKSAIEDSFPLYRWKNIWKNIHNRFIDKFDRVVCFKFIYNILPTKKKLFDMKTTGYNDPLCVTCNLPESNLHMLYFCSKVKSLFRFMKELCENLCSIKVEDPLNFLYFDIQISKVKKDICSIILSTYLGVVWSCRNKANCNLYIKMLSALKYNAKTILACNNYKAPMREMLLSLDYKICDL